MNSSISSSPLWKPNHATLSIYVLDAPSRSREDGHRHLGVATSYLDSLHAGDILQVTVRKSAAGFSMPEEPETTPMICIAAGTGIAPFRGFLQERAALGIPVGLQAQDELLEGQHGWSVRRSRN